MCIIAHTNNGHIIVSCTQHVIYYDRAAFLGKNCNSLPPFCKMAAIIYINNIIRYFILQILIICIFSLFLVDSET